MGLTGAAALHLLETYSSSTSGRQAVQANSKGAGDETRAAGQAQAGPAPPVQAGSAARSAQMPATAAGGGLHGSHGTMGSREQPAKAVDGVLLSLTSAAAQRLLDTSRVEEAAAVLDHMLKVAENAEEQSTWMAVYMELVFTILPQWDTGVLEEAGRLRTRATEWRKAQEGRLKSLTCRVTTTGADIQRVRDAWEGRLQAHCGGEESQPQVLAEEACVLVHAYAGALDSMKGCLDAMQERFTAFLQTAEAEQR